MRYASSFSEQPIITRIITEDVRTGKDAVIATNSVVKQDVELYNIFGDVSVKVIGNRKNYKN